ncbi:MAG: class I SAM-dependent methyltransferase [Acidimicrobiales bacterium]
MLHRDRQRASSFGAQAQRYDRTRPGYPSALIEYLAPAPAPGSAPLEVLDVGCGTGIAARLLAERGCRVTGVEPDRRMAEVARSHGLELELVTFEKWDPGGRRFDLVTSAQAWHWVDPVAGALKAAEVLRPAGRVGLFWNDGQPPADLQTLLDEVYRRLGAGSHLHSVLLGGKDPGVGRDQLAIEGLLESGHFGQPVIEPFAWEEHYTTEQWCDQLPTHSDHQTMPAQARADLIAAVAGAIDEFGGGFTMSYETKLIVARRL